MKLNNINRPGIVFENTTVSTKKRIQILKNDLYKTDQNIQKQFWQDFFGAFDITNTDSNAIKDIINIVKTSKRYQSTLQEESVQKQSMWGSMKQFIGTKLSSKLINMLINNVIKRFKIKTNVEKQQVKNAIDRTIEWNNTLSTIKTLLANQRISKAERLLRRFNNGSVR